MYSPDCRLGVFDLELREQQHPDRDEQRADDRERLVAAVAG